MTWYHMTIWWRGVVWPYRISFVLIALSFVIIMCLLTLLLGIKGQYTYYTDQKMGLVPACGINFSNYIKPEELKALDLKLTKAFTVPYSVRGANALLSEASFSVGESRTLEKNMVVLGIDFSRDRTLTFLQHGQRFRTPVLEIGELGRWFLKIPKVSGFQSGQCRLLFGDKNIRLNAYDYDSYFQIKAACHHCEANDDFASFAVEFLSRFLDNRYSGIGMDRFSGKPIEENVSQKENMFDIYVKPALLSYAGIIFDQGESVIRVLLAGSLFRSVARYDIGLDTDLEFNDGSLRVRVLDSVYFDTEANYNNNIVLMNFNSFQEAFELSRSRSFIYLYGIKEDIAEEIQHFVLDKYPEASFVLRDEAVPTRARERRIIHAGIHSFYTLFFILTYFIVIVRLMKFYSVLNTQLIFIKQFGSKTLIYSTCTLGLALLSVLISLPILLYVYLFNNQLLSQYLYPPIYFQFSSFLFSCVLLFTLVAICFLIEKYILYGMLTYTQRGENQ